MRVAYRWHCYRLSTIFTDGTRMFNLAVPLIPPSLLSTETLSSRVHRHQFSLLQPEAWATWNDSSGQAYTRQSLTLQSNLNLLHGKPVLGGIGAVVHGVDLRLDFKDNFTILSRTTY